MALRRSGPACGGTDGGEGVRFLVGWILSVSEDEGAGNDTVFDGGFGVSAATVVVFGLELN